MQPCCSNQFDLETKIYDLQVLINENIEETKKALKDGRHSVADICEYIQNHIENLLSPKFNQPKVREFLRQKLSSITTFEDLFISLKERVSWFNYELIVKLVNVFLPRRHLLKRKWSAYHEKLKDYFNNNNDVAIKCADGIEFGLSDVLDTKVLIAKVARDDYTLNDLFFFYRAIPESLKVAQTEYCFYFCSIGSGCLELKYCIPDYIYSVLFPLTDEHLLSLANIGVIKLSCGSFEYEIKEVNIL